MSEPQMAPRLKPPCDPADALEVLRTLRTAGHIAYFAGGCVRDMLLGLVPKDYDVATDAPPKRVRALFPNTQAVGAAFGVVLVRQGASVIEVATFRSDGSYIDGRRPSSVEFSSPQQDARRRDFTINGLFFDPIEQRVIDLVDGQADLRQRRLRAIGDPRQRFREDHLRLLRAVRFAARFDLTIEPDTEAAIQAAAPLLKSISPERIADELRLILTHPWRRRGWRLLFELKLAPVIFRFLPPPVPERIDPARSIFLNLTDAQPIAFGLALAAGTLCVRMQAGEARFPQLLSRDEIGRSVRAMRQALKLSNLETDQMHHILASLEPLLAPPSPPLATIKRFLAHADAPPTRLLLEALHRVGVERARIDWLAAQFASLASENVAPAPLITGEDLLGAGLRQGPLFKRILDQVYDAQLENRLSERDAAIRLALQLAAENNPEAGDAR